MNFGPRLKEARKTAGISVKDLAKAAGLSATAIYDLERGDKLSSTKTATLASILGVSALWLETGTAGWRPESTKSSLGSVKTGRKPGKAREVPLISAENALALLSITSDPKGVDSWVVCPIPCSPRTFAMRIGDDDMSMISQTGKSYPPASILYVDPAQTTAGNGDRILAAAGSSLFFTVLMNHGGKRWLAPLNVQYPPYFDDDFEVIGKVIGAFLQ